MTDEEELQRLRRQVLGDAYVSAANPADADDATRTVQRMITEQAWSSWATEALSLREHSLMVIAMAAAQSREAELTLHVGAAVRNYASEATMLAVIHKVAAYCGAPAGLAVWRAYQAARAASS